MCIRQLLFLANVKAVVPTERQRGRSPPATCWVLLKLLGNSPPIKSINVSILFHSYMDRFFQTSLKHSKNQNSPNVKAEVPSEHQRGRSPPATGYTKLYFLNMKLISTFPQKQFHGRFIAKFDDSRKQLLDLFILNFEFFQVSSVTNQIIIFDRARTY